jgi:hypothetical protein
VKLLQFFVRHRSGWSVTSLELLANPVEQLLKTPALAIQYGELLVQLFNAVTQKLGMPLIIIP